MNDAYIGSLIVAVVTLLGQFLINRYIINTSYESKYERALIKYKVEAIKQLYEFVFPFTVNIMDDGSYEWMNSVEAIKNKLAELDTLQRNTLFLPIGFRDQMSKLVNLIIEFENYQFFNNASRSNEEILIDRINFACLVRIIAGHLEADLFSYLQNKENIKEILKNNEKIIRGTHWFNKEKEYRIRWNQRKFSPSPMKQSDGNTSKKTGPYIWKRVK